MTFEIGLVFGILAFAIVLFVSEIVRVDVVSMIVLVLLAISGLVEPAQAISGFSNPAVITVWAVFVLSGGLSRTGVAGILGRQVLRFSGNSEGRLVVVIMLTAAFLSAFMNNVGVAALLLPVVMDISRQTGYAPSKLLMPLAFSSLLGGLTTQIGTPPNILVSAALEESGLAPFSMFDFTPVGGAVVLAGIAYMSLIGRRLLPDRDPAKEMAGADVDLDSAYSLSDRVFVLDVPKGSPLAGKTIAESRVGSALGLNVMGIRRRGRVRLAPDPETRFEPGDQIVVQGQRDALREVGAQEYLSFQDDSIGLADLVSDEVGLAEVSPRPGCRLLKRSLRDIDFRNRFNVLVLAAWRGGQPLRTHLAAAKLESDDVFLVHALRRDLERLRESPDFLVSKIADPADFGRYQLEERLMSVRVPEGSPIVGQTLAESRLGDVFSLGVMAIERAGRKTLIPKPDDRLEAGDILLVKGKQEDLRTVGGLHGLNVDAEQDFDVADLESERIGIAEAVLAPRSSAAGKTLSELHFREKYGFNVMAVMRGGVAHRNLRYLALEFGDALLLHGPRQKLKLLGSDPDFLVLTEAAQEPPLTEKAPFSAIIMVGVVGAVILGWLPIYIAAVAGAVLMVLCGCLSMDEAYRAIEWRAVFLIAGMLPLGLAIQQSGAAEFVTRAVVGAVGGFGPLAVIAGVYLMAAIAAQIMPTSAVAILVAPLALNASADLGMSPYALLMTVALAASGSFMSPVAHPANVLTMGPGGYRFSDYIKVGLPLTIVCLVVVLVLLPLVWPLTS